MHIFQRFYISLDGILLGINIIHSSLCVIKICSIKNKLCIQRNSVFIYRHARKRLLGLPVLVFKVKSTKY